MAPQDPKHILKEAESVTANIKQLRQGWSDYVQGADFQKECDDVFTAASNIKVRPGEGGGIAALWLIHMCPLHRRV